MKQQANLLSASIAIIVLIVVPYFASADSLIRNSDAEAVVQQNEQLRKPLTEALSATVPKSPGKAFLFSAIVPGSGEFYCGAKRGALFVATEIAFWATYFVLNGQGEDIKTEYIAYVDEHIRFEADSPATSTANWTLEDYEHATQSDNWHYVYTEENGRPLDRVGKFYWDDLPADRIDQPGAIDMISESRAEAREKRDSSNDKLKQAKFFLGLVVINHVVSAIDARIAAIVYNKQIPETKTEVSLYPTISPSGQVGAHLALYRSF